MRGQRVIGRSFYGYTCRLDARQLHVAYELRPLQLRPSELRASKVPASELRLNDSLHAHATQLAPQDDANGLMSRKSKRKHERSPNRKSERVAVDSTQDTPPPSGPPASSSKLRWMLRIGLPAFLLLAGVYAFADWYRVLPADTPRQFVGGHRCIECHQNEHQKWQGSHHDLAMDEATPETVLGDFSGTTLEHHGIVSTMFQRDGKFWINTEGPDGKLSDFEIKYVFGVDPLQQYMVEFERDQGTADDELARVQVLRVSWDVERQRWFYLAPPDVSDKLAPDDPLHWTGSAQNWNHMCAICHSTNLQKQFDVATRSYHTTFTDIDVNCEACHGPGSLHVQMAESPSLFWDRHHRFGLRELKSASSQNQIETCAPCHSRRGMIHACNGAEPSYYDCYENGLLTPETYYPDGQIRDEVYVFGSFVQSKMYHKNIRCSDCHDPHTARLIYQGNQVCTSCHQHTAAKYDTPAHHNHPQDSEGAKCVACHMPDAPFMDIDLRRDHSLRVPRPDLSVKWKTPNACTGCHLDESKLPEASRGKLNYYADWMKAYEAGDEAVKSEVDRVNQWSSDWFKRWYGDKPRPHFVDALAPAFAGDPKSVDGLIAIVEDRESPAIVRASALTQLMRFAPERALPLAERLLTHSDPSVRATAVRCLSGLPPEQLRERLTARLHDSTRLVRTEAARALAAIPRNQLKLEDQKALTAALDELITGQQVNADQAGAHLALGLLAESMGQPQRAIASYQAAVHVQPNMAGPRSNLSQLLQRMGDEAGARQMLKAELQLLRRDAELAPEQDTVQYRYGLSLYLDGQLEAALAPIERARQLAPHTTDYHTSYALILERLGRREEALEAIEQAISTRPRDPGLRAVRQRLIAP